MADRSRSAETLWIALLLAEQLSAKKAALDRLKERRKAKK
jgi:hypothetical protein